MTDPSAKTPDSKPQERPIFSPEEVLLDEALSIQRAKENMKHRKENPEGENEEKEENKEKEEKDENKNNEYIGLLRGFAAAPGDDDDDDKKIGTSAEQADQKKAGRVRYGQRKLYRGLADLDRTALCLSGGGIRSAAFSLGVIQALAVHPRPEPLRGPLTFIPRRDAARSAGAASEAPVAAASRAGRSHGKDQGCGDSSMPADPFNVVAIADDSLLRQIDYLSTVSGGGYIGAWLMAWLSCSRFSVVWKNLTRRPAGPDTEPETLSWLRAYSSFLTPKRGLMSADTWAGMALLGRNLFLNWLIIIPVLCIVLLGMKILALLSVGFARWEGESAAGSGPAIAHFSAVHFWLLVIAALGAALLALALRFVNRWRPTSRPAPKPGAKQESCGQRDYLFGYLLPSLGAAALLTTAMASTPAIALLDGFGKWPVIGASALCGVALYALGMALERRFAGPADVRNWLAAGLVHGALAGAALYFFTLAPTDGAWIFNDLFLPLLFGVPWLLFAQVTAECVFVGLASFHPDSENDREWLGRSAGWMMVTGLVWLVLMFFTFAGSLFVSDVADGARGWLVTTVGGLSGTLAAAVAKSALSPGPSASQTGTRPVVTALILAVAAPVFGAALITMLSVALDAILLDDQLVLLVRRPGYGLGEEPWRTALGWLVAGLVAEVALVTVTSHCININRFSLHALYRNRLIRTFLGASRPSREPDKFTGFDPKDNKPLHTLWPAPEGDWRPFNVINMTLNVVSGDNLAWQERKAESFTATPLHCGNPKKGYRLSTQYGSNDKGDEGISLGTAMAISGAAATPNMGYHSSPSLTLLMTLFNVRLGWWLGNPGPEGANTYDRDGPKCAIVPLLDETFGLTTDKKPWVYLSDGGHFENLGLYEMIRRRCRTIICVDAGADPGYEFEDLGNAVRKIELDLGVRVRFRGLSHLKPRPASETSATPLPYHAIGEIDYPATDGGGCFGLLLYIKPGYHGIESAGVRSYAVANRDFPHQTTLNQFYAESQFESYRALGFEITDDLLNTALGDLPETTRRKARLHDILKAIAARRTADPTRGDY